MTNGEKMIHRARGVWERGSGQSDRSVVELKQEAVLGDVLLVMQSALRNHDVFNDEDMRALIEKGKERINYGWSWQADAVALGMALLQEAGQNARSLHRDISV